MGGLLQDIDNVMLVAPFKAWFMIFRIQAVLVWAVASVCVSTAWAAMQGYEIVWSDFFLVVLIASVAQGFPAHIINEIYDWKSGADRVGPGKTSGGSKVIRSGLATVAQLWKMFWITTALDFVLVMILYFRTSSILLLAIFVVGFMACIFYTLPPVSLAYRPFVGEWLGGFTGVFLNMTGSYYLQASVISPSILVLAVALGLVYISIMLLFHYIDFENDAGAVPKKNTTIVRLGLIRSRRYVLVILGAALLLSGWMGFRIHPVFFLLTAGTGLQWFFQFRCQPEKSSSVVLNGKKITFIMLGFAVAFSSAADLRFILMLPAFAAGFYLHRKFGKLNGVTT